MRLAWGSKVSVQFATKVFQVVQGLNWAPDQANDLMSCMAFETGETFSPSIRNAAGSGAVGLLQFMPATAISLGTSSAQLERMAALQQLDYVKKYFAPYAHKISTISDMYMAILMPKYIDAPINKEIFICNTIAYRQNAGLDTNRDGHITKGEITRKVRQKLEKGLSEEFSAYFQDIIPSA